jgi:hypothetical protein
VIPDRPPSSSPPNQLLDAIKTADWIIDLGPEGDDGGGDDDF